MTFYFLKSKFLFSLTMGKSQNNYSMMKVVFLVFLAIQLAGTAMAGDDIEGKWKTVDDVTGEVKSIIEITKNDGKLYGTILKLFDEDINYDPVCEKCKDHLKGKKIIGMQIINGLKLDEGKWRGNKGILDPDNGKYYNVKICVDQNDNNKLIVRGCIFFLFRKQIWLREE